MTWRAVHRVKRVPVAIKIIDPPAPERRERVQRLFAHEVRAVARLDHPGIVRVHDFGALPETGDPRLPAHAPYLVMEWVSGGTLARTAGLVDWPTLRATLAALLDALAHAHARGVIHQDIKAANILRGERGPVLSDFGIAFSLDHALEAAPRFMGTPDYMAPEQIRMRRRAIGPWSDLYALGCLTYEQVTGRAPYGDKGRVEVLHAHLEAAVPPMPLRDGFPPGLEAWVHRLLDKDPARRYRFAADAAEALAALPGATPSTPLPRPPAMPLPGTGRALFALRETGVVGRATEQATMWSRLREVVTERTPRLLLLEGPTGAGKSRLGLWLARRAHTEGVADALRSTGTPDPDAHGGGLAAMLGHHLRVTGLSAPALLTALVDRLGDPDAAWGLAAALSPNRRFELDGHAVMLGSTAELDEALCHAFACLTARDRPRVVLLDAATDDTLRWIEHLLTAHPTLPVLVVVTVRLDRPRAAARLDRLRAHPATTCVSVGPLDPAALAATLRARLPLEEDLLTQLVRRADGSPLFAEEIIAHWLHTGALVERAGGYGLDARARDAVPHGLLDIWRARVDDVIAPLGRPGRVALEAAAILGGSITRDLWRHVAADLDPALLDAARERLLDARLAFDQIDGDWRFAHPMLREALLASARSADRAAPLHRRAAAALLEAGADPSHIADHHLAADDVRQAVGLLFDAARRHRRRRDHLAMRRDLMRLAGALRRLRRPPDAPERIELRILWAEACQGQDDLSAAWRHVARAAEQARRRDDPRLFGWARYTQAFLRLRERGAVEQWLRPARDAALYAGDAELSWSANHALTFCLVQHGRFDEAEASLTALVGLLAGHADDVKRGDLLRLMAIIARGRERYDEAEASAAQALALYIRSGSRLKQSHGYNLVGDLARYAGRLEASVDAYREAVRLSELSGGNYDALTDELNLCLVLLGMQRYDEARRRLTRIAQRAERVRYGVGLAFAHLCLLVCEARDGRWAAYDARWRRIEPMQSGEIVDGDVAVVAESAAEFALAAGETDRAAAAWRLAAAQYTRLGQDERAAAATARAEGL